MPRQTRAQRETIERVMHAFKEGDLETSRGTPVKTQRQAVAIALHEAGATNQESPTDNRRTLRRTKRRERAAERSRADLYAEATLRGIPGRSRMTKAELVRALRP